MIQATPYRVRLLVVDQSPAGRERFRRLFAGVPDIDVVAEAASAERALRLFDEASPSAVLIDCDLPEPGSFAAVRQMMGLYPIPIVMVTKQTKTAPPELEARALETGAVALAGWVPGDLGSGKGSDQDLVRTVRAMSEVKVVRRRGQRAKEAPVPLENIRPDAPLPSDFNIEVVAVGASTGGPAVLQTILAGLGAPLPVPLLLVQHLSRGFHDSLVRWLSESTNIPVWTAEHGMPLRPGIAYLAPDDKHMMVDAADRLVLTNDPPENGSRPSVSVLFRSVAYRYGPHAIGILLTGMGRDGAKELRLMRDRGAVTIAQDEETSVVHGMPGEAIKLKGARYILTPERISSVVQHHLLMAREGRRASCL